MNTDPVISTIPTIYTIGHSTHPIEEFLGLLTQHGIQTLLDIRTYPGSRRCPQFNQERLEAALAEAGIGYGHDARLGGRRHGHIAGSGNEGWRVAAFRSYADYASTDPRFLAGLDALEHDARTYRLAYMCSEYTHLKCHRRIVSDYLAARGWNVQHIRSNGTLEAHTYTEHAFPVEGRVLYPAPGSLAVSS